MPILEYFPKELIELNKEVKNHPNLEVNSEDLPNKIGDIAAYCSVVLDGFYTHDDLVKLAGILVHKLRKKREIIVH